MSAGPGALAAGIPTTTSLVARPWAGGRRRAGALLVTVGAVALIALFTGRHTGVMMLVAAVALMVTAAALLVPAVALTLLVVTELADVSGLLAAHGLPSVALPVLGIGVGSALLAAWSPRSRARFASVPWVPALLMGGYLLGVLAALLAGSGQVGTVAGLWLDGLFLVVVLVLARLVERPWTVAAAIVAAPVAIAAVTLAHRLAPAGPWDAALSAAAGVLPGAPAAGPALVIGLPLALALAHRAVAARRRAPAAGWTAAVLLVLAAVWLAESEAVLLGAVVAGVLWVVGAGPSVRRRALVLLPVIALVLLLPGVADRLPGAAEPFADEVGFSAPAAVTERATAVEIAGMIIAEHPLLGTGPGSFAGQVAEYAVREPDLVVPGSLPSPGLYLRILAETGTLGLACFAALIGGCAALALRSTVRLAGAPADGSAGTAPDSTAGTATRALAAAVPAAIVGWSAIGLLADPTSTRPLAVVLALAGLLHVLTRDRAVTQATDAAARGLRSGLWIAAVMVVAGAAVGGTILGLLGQNVYTARAAQTLVPAAGIDPVGGLETRSLPPVLPAYAAMIQGQQSRSVLRVDADPATGLLTFVGTGATAQEAERRVVAALAAAPGALHRHGADRQYTLLEVSPVEMASERVPPSYAMMLAAAAVALELAFCLAVLKLARKPEAESAGQ